MNLRKQSIKLLKSKGIFLEILLPELAPKTDFGKIRSTQSVSRRIIELITLYSLTISDVKNEKLTKYLQDLNLYNGLLEKERDFFIKGNCNLLNRSELINLSWLNESIYILGWCVTLVEDLCFPNENSDSEFILPQVPSSASPNTIDEFSENCFLRSETEIYQQVDLHYCLHWLMRSFPKKYDNIIDLSVILERRRALEWLINKDEEDWWEISLDT